MKSIINDKVLCLNNVWQAIGFCSVKKALEDMNSCKSPKKALKVEFWESSDGVFDFEQVVEMTPLAFEEWVNLPLRKYDPDSCVRTCKLEIRAPRIVISPFYNKMPIKTFRPTKRNLYDRYGGKCIWTGETLSYKDSTIEHMQPRSKGGKNSWPNLGLAKARINRLKSDRTVEQFEKEEGFKQKYKLTEPPPIAASVLIKEAIYEEWRPFLIKNLR